MTNKSDDLPKYIQPIIIAIVIAAVTATSTMLYRHEISIFSNKTSIKSLKTEIYRQTLSLYEEREITLRSDIQLLKREIRENPNTSPYKQAKLEAQIQLLELIQQNRQNYVEEYAARGSLK